MKAQWLICTGDNFCHPVKCFLGCVKYARRVNFAQRHFRTG